MSRRINFERVNSAALRQAEAVVRGFLPDGRREGNEWVARNPTREDRRPGSFKVNLVTGKGADFRTGDRFGDLVGMVAYLRSLTQREAAIRLAEALGIDPFE